jgi:signal transduction histidine kinase
LGLCEPELEVQVAGFGQTQIRTDVDWGTIPRVMAVSVTVGVVSFVVTELMHRVLVPDLGRHWERLLAETVSAVVVAGLTAGFMEAANQRQEAALLRMQVISEMNHHIRNALAAISLTTDSIQNQQCVRVISESVDRIEWTLREILLRRKPISEKEIDRLRYTATRNPHRTAYASQEKTNE